MKICLAAFCVLGVALSGCVQRTNNETADTESIGSPQGYDSLSPESKLEYLRAQTMASVYQAPLPTKLANPDPALEIVDTNFLTVAFNWDSDFMPRGRQKKIHSFGAVARFSFIPMPGMPYTGMFSGAYGIMRISVATPPTPTSFVPGMAIKFPIAGASSLNLFAMHGLDGQGSNRNIFAMPFFNTLLPVKNPLSPQKVIETRFATVKSNPNHLPVDDLSRFNQQGQAIPAPVSPANLAFVPNPALGWDPTTSEDFRVMLSRIPPGTILYSVYEAGPSGRQAITKIGEMRLDSQFVASKFGDENLFFRHDRGAER